jgi:hypothetical protein
MSRVLALLAILTLAVVFAGAAQQGQGQTPSSFPLSQSIRERGSSVTGAYEGWYRSSDGSARFLVGYFNRNTKQELDIPVGPSNHLEPGGPDQGQPTHFAPGRQSGVFTVKVPAGLGSGTLTWTLISNGQTNTITMHTRREWLLEPFEDVASKNTPPVVKLAANGAAITGPPSRIAASYTTPATLPLTLEAWVTDDPATLDVGNALLSIGRSTAPPSVSWSLFRGPGPVTFDNARPRVTAPDGRIATIASFAVPGEYILRLQANDQSGDGGGGFQCCWTNVHVGVTVTNHNGQ